MAACAHAQPAHTYRVPTDVGRLVADDAAFADFSRSLRADLTDRNDKDQLFVVSMLDALDGHWPDAVAKLDRAAALETDPQLKVMLGLTIRVWADAIATGGDSADSFRAALARKLDGLPIDLVRDSLSMLRTMSQVFTPEVCRGLVQDSVGPEAQKGPISLQSAHAIVFQRYAVKRLVPVGKVVDEVLGARGISPKTQ